MRLWVRLALAMAAIAIVPLVATGLLASRVAAQRAEEGAAEILAREAVQLSTFVNTWADAQADALLGWMRLNPLGEQGPAQRQALLRAVYKAVPWVNTVVLVDDGGVVAGPVYRTPFEDPKADEVFADRPLGSPARAAALVERLPIGDVGLGGVAWGEPYRPPDGDWAVPLAVSGPYGEGFVLGAELSLRAVIDPLRAQVTPTHAVALLSREGVPFFGAEHPVVHPDRLGPFLGLDAVVLIDTDAGYVRGSVATAPTTGFTAAVLEPAAVADAAAASIRSRTLSIVLFAALFAAGVGVVVATTISRPVDRLRDAANAVADGDYARRVDTGNGRELDDLARAFNEMAARLERNRRAITVQQREIEAFNRELQDRVDARTAELRAAQQRLVESGQLAAVAEVGAGLAHELNNPLAGILGLAQVARARAAGSGLEPSLDRIEAQARRASEVVATMLRFTSGGADPGGAAPVKLASVLDDVLSLVRGPFRQANLEVDLGAPVPDDLEVRVDQVLAVRALVQLLNAVRAGLPAGARLAVTARAVGDEVCVELAADAPIAVGTGRDDWMAAGMGVWLARHILDQTGGRVLDVEADGARLCVLLPGVRA